MILRALYDLATHEGLSIDRDFPLVPVAWLVTVTADGRIAGITDTRVETETRGKKPKLVAKSFPVPYQIGRSGTKAPPSFFVDNAKYVFGRATADKEFAESEGAEKSAWFRERVAECVAATGDPGAVAVLTMLEAVASGDQAVRLPEDCRSNDLFAFIYAPEDVDTLVHMRPAVQAYWRKVRSADANGSADSGDGRFECLVTGAPVKTPELFPKVKYVPGGQTSGSPLVSFNASAFTSYGLEGNENAPISREAGEAVAIALQRLLHPAFPDPRPEHRGETMARRNYRLTDDTVACYWSDSQAADDFLDAFAIFFEPDPAVVGGMYHSVWRGRSAPVKDAGAFCALILSGAQGRMIVRDWFTTSVAAAAEHLARHFADLSVVRNTPVPKGGELPDALPLRVLLGALAPFGRRDAIPPSLATSVFSAALRGTPYPLSLLQRAIERTRAEMGKTEWADLERRDARVSLIKAVLNRRRRLLPSDYPELTVALDPNNSSPGYLCGRLMAVIERLQQVALPEINSTVVDRFFGAASATPRAVFTRLLRNARHHGRKAREEASTRGLARWLEGQLDAIAVRFDVQNNGFPAFLDLEQQGLFILGYHQQRHELWRKRDPVAVPEIPMPAVAPAEANL
jgi:CRISPR-associated protein Csd1